MTKRKNSRQKPEETLDSFSEEHKKPGRPPTVRPSEVYGRALNYRGIFDLIWDKLSQSLLKAASEEEVVKAFATHAPGYGHLQKKKRGESWFRERSARMPTVRHWKELIVPWVINNIRVAWIVGACNTNLVKAAHYFDYLKGPMIVIGLLWKLKTVRNRIGLFTASL